MFGKKKLYKKLPGKKAGLVGIHTLHMGEDHLLFIYSVFFRETYRRFYYSDIQSVIIRKTIRGAVWNIILGVMAALFLLATLGAEDKMLWVFGIISGLIFFLFLANCVMGPTCICHIRTPAQTEILPSLNRLRTARRVMGKILPLIEKEQGRLTPEILEKTPMSPAEMQKTPGSGREQKQVSPGFHRILFALLFTGGFLTIGDMLSDFTVFTLLSYLLSMSFMVLLIIALVRQHGSDLEEKVKICTWSALGFIIAENICGLVLYFFLIFQQRELAGNQWELIRAMALLNPLEKPWMKGIYFFSVCGSLLLGGAGLFMLYDKKYEKREEYGIRESARKKSLQTGTEGFLREEKE